MRTFLFVPLLLGLLPRGIQAQGSLTPPGAPGPLMKTLQQIEPRQLIASTPFTITNSGSYYLAGPLTNSGPGNGIIIMADDVTVDLNGFALVGNTTTGIGIHAPATQHNLRVVNGTVRNWGGDGLGLLNAINSQFTSLRVCNNGGDGLRAGSGCEVRDCLATANANGIRTADGATVRNCVAQGNGLDGLHVGNGCLVVGNNCQSNGLTSASAGIHVVGSSTRVDENTVTYTSGVGIEIEGTANLIVRNNARGNTVTGYQIPPNNDFGRLVLNGNLGFTNAISWANFDTSCGPGQVVCASSICATVVSDPYNCGGCGNVCPTGANCVSGICSCPAGEATCPGACANLATDTNNCGSCGSICPKGASCVASTCVCPTGDSICNGFCVNLATDPNNCGLCGHTCLTGHSCISGICN